MTHQKKRHAPGASGSVARDILDADGSEYIATIFASQGRFDQWLDHPTPLDRHREIDGALLAAQFASLPVDQWRSIGGAL